MFNKEKIIDTINKLYPGAVVQLWNNYCHKVDCLDDCIYQMDEFNDIVKGFRMKPYVIAKACCYGSFCPTDNYFWFDGYGNLRSCLLPVCDNSESPLYKEEIADYIIDNNDPLHCNEIQKILDENKD